MHAVLSVLPIATIRTFERPDVLEHKGEEGDVHNIAMIKSSIAKRKGTMMNAPTTQLNGDLVKPFDKWGGLTRRHGLNA